VRRRLTSRRSSESPATGNNLKAETVLRAENVTEPVASLPSLQLPLSDHKLELNTCIVLLSSAQSREKCLKIVQYLAKLQAYLFAFCASFGFNSLLHWSSHAAGIAKNTSQARRFFKFFRWVKHLEDVPAAQGEGSLAVACLMALSIFWNLVADMSEDACSLERLGFLPNGSLPDWAELNSNRCQLVLAIVEICLSFVRFRRRKQEQDCSMAGQRRLAMATLELSKFVTDIGKAFWDCELSFASELLFVLCGLWSALVSTHKFTLRALKL